MKIYQFTLFMAFGTVLSGGLGAILTVIYHLSGNQEAAAVAFDQSWTLLMLGCAFAVLAGLLMRFSTRSR